MFVLVIYSDIFPLLASDFIRYLSVYVHLLILLQSDSYDLVMNQDFKGKKE